MILLHVTTSHSPLIFLLKKKKEITTMHVRETASRYKHTCGDDIEWERSISFFWWAKKTPLWLLLDSSRVFFHLAKYFLVSGWRWGRMQQARIDSINESSSWTSFTIYLVSFSVLRDQSFCCSKPIHTTKKRFRPMLFSSMTIIQNKKKEKETLSTSTPLPPKKGQRDL